MTAPLDGCLERVRRAGHHLHTLADESRVLVQNQPVITGPEPDHEPGWYRWRVASLEQPPLHLSIILGEFVHNLRAALDNLVCVLVRRTNAKDHCGGIAFPICECPTGKDGWEGKQRRLLARGLTQIQLQKLDAFQPYHREDKAGVHPLAVLRWLSNTDKHRVLHFSVFSASDQEPDLELQFLEAVPGAGADVRYMPGRLHVGSTILRVGLSPLNPEPEISLSITLPLETRFSERGFSLPELDYMFGVVVSVIETFL